MPAESTANQKWYHTVIVAVLIALLAGGTSPWWFGELKVALARKGQEPAKEVEAKLTDPTQEPEAVAPAQSTGPTTFSTTQPVAPRPEPMQANAEANLGFEEVRRDVLYEPRRGRWWTKSERSLARSLAEAKGLCDNLQDGKWSLPDKDELDSLIDARRKAEPGEPRVSPLFNLRGRNFFWSSSRTGEQDENAVLVNLNRPIHDPDNPERYKEAFSIMAESAEGNNYPADVLCVRYFEPPGDE